MQKAPPLHLRSGASITRIAEAYLQPFGYARVLPFVAENAPTDERFSSNQNSICRWALDAGLLDL